MLSLKVFSYGKFKLFDEYFLESIKVVLFVKIVIGHGVSGTVLLNLNKGEA